MQIFIINLSKSTTRRDFQRKQLDILGLGYTIVNAVTVEDISIEIVNKHFYDWQRPLRKSEIACYYSHRTIWEKIISNNKPALILEDDALLSRKIPQLLDILGPTNNADLIQLETRSRKKLISRKSIGITPNYSLHRLYQDRTGAAGYILAPSGAKKLIEHEEKHGIGLADAHITSCYNLKSYQLIPATIIQLDQCKKYDIACPLTTESSISTIEKPDVAAKTMLFRLKRLAAQVRMGANQLVHSYNSKRAYIPINKNDFNE